MSTWSAARAPTRQERYAGCLLGGAVGDALGAEVEFNSLKEIRARYGPAGVRDLPEGLPARFTDDTQMSLFTAEGLLRAHNRFLQFGVWEVLEVVNAAYLRWLATQGSVSSHPDFARDPDGWLFTLRALHERRGPGATCLSALEAGGAGTLDSPINTSKGCGAVMRAAPAGLAGDAPFKLGCEVGAVTHGHPSGYLPAGYLARVVHDLASGASLAEAAGAASLELQAWDGHEETLDAVTSAIDLARRGRGSPEEVESLGKGRTGEEALAIALFCSLKATDFASGVRLAVNHGGDSDSTGAITGNILGTLHGKSGIPGRWLGQLELAPEIEEVATDLYRHFGPTPLKEPDAEKYPPW